LKGEILSGKDCVNAPSNKRCDKSSQNINDAACKPPTPVPTVAPKPKLTIQVPAPQPPVIEQQQVETHSQSPITLPSVGNAVETPVIQESSSSSIALVVLAVLVIIGGIVYLQFFHRRRR
jgi:hypothetical protein